MFLTIDIQNIDKAVAPRKVMSQHRIKVKSFQGMFRVFIHTTETSGRAYGGDIISITGNIDVARRIAEREAVVRGMPIVLDF